MSKKAKVLISLIFILYLAFFIRISWTEYNAADTRISHDGLHYHKITMNLLNDKGYGYTPNEPSSWRPPGYPFVLYAIYSLFGSNNYLAVRMLHCLLEIATCLLIFLLTRKVTKGMPYRNVIALVASFLYALNYLVIVITQAYLTEILTSFLIILTIYLFTIANTARGIKFYTTATLGSLSLWYATLTRPATLLFWIWIGLWCLIENRNNLKRVLKAFLVALCTFAIVILPWTFRNYNLHQKFLLISSNGGTVFHIAHHPLSDGKTVSEDLRYTPKQQSQLDQLDEIEIQKTNYKFAFDWIVNNPGKELKLIFLKQKHLWTLVEEPPLFIDRLSNSPIPVMRFHSLMILGLLGMLFATPHLRRFTLPFFYMLNHALIISLFYFYDGMRVRIAFIPYLCIFASIGAVYLFPKIYGLGGILRNANTMNK